VGRAEVGRPEAGREEEGATAASAAGAGAAAASPGTLARTDTGREGPSLLDTGREGSCLLDVGREGCFSAATAATSAGGVLSSTVASRCIGAGVGSAASARVSHMRSQSHSTISRAEKKSQGSSGQERFQAESRANTKSHQLVGLRGGAAAS
jgi:hypothetical protein